MINLPTILICTAAVRDNVNLIWEAMGRGPNNVSRKLCAIDPEATFETSPTHYMMQDMGASDVDVARWQALCEGDVPGLDDNGNPIMWGEDGVISQADAIAACGGGNMQVYSAAGLETTQQTNDWRDGTFLGVGLQFVPDEPL